MVLYNITILALRLAISVASLFNTKARLFSQGRKNTFRDLEAKLANNHARLVWIHCSSLGEFEQARPLLETIRNENPSVKLLLSFFSPSGYEVRKSYKGADIVCYLPMDTSGNAKRWLEVTRPALAIFIKYEFWLNYSQALKTADVPLISISSIFRSDQVFFKWYGGLFRRILRNFDHFFVQNKQSIELLSMIGITNTTIAGDTRFDRVQTIKDLQDSVPHVETFKGSSEIMVVGSSWPEDMNVLVPFINETALKFIVAPHEISESALADIENSLQRKVVRYSKLVPQQIADYEVLLIDNVGMLSRLYRYGEFAYVGGGFGKGLHNILEAACFGVPIFFGNKNYQKFREANDLIMRGGAFEVSDYSDLRSKFESVTVPENFLLACEVTRSYITENLGATEKIMRYCRPLLRS